MRLGSGVWCVVFDAGLVLSLSAAAAFAGQSATSLTAAGMPQNCAIFAAKV